MKKLIYGLTAFIAFCFIIQSCNKLNDPKVTTVGTLKIGATEVMIGQPDTLVITDAQATDKVVWTVAPTGSNTITTNGAGAIFTFSKTGTYTVTAKVNNGAPKTATITVNSTVYIAPGTSASVPLTGDEITLNPKFYKNTAADSSYIFFVVNTKNKYCPASRLNISTSIDASGNYTSNFVNVTSYTNCPVGTEPIYTVINYKQTPTVLANGTYNLTIGLNGTNYTGTVVVATSTITFNWAHTAGVVMSNKVINR